MKALFDSNILIDYLGGVEPSFAEVKRYDDRAVSVITWIEVLAGVPPEAEAKVRQFLGDFAVIRVSDSISEEAIRIRRARRMKLPDAIIWATARVDGRLLITRNTKDFPTSDPGVREPYRL